jgi:hypothetical protein
MFGCRKLVVLSILWAAAPASAQYLPGQGGSGGGDDGPIGAGIHANYAPMMRLPRLQPRNYPPTFNYLEPPWVINARLDRILHNVGPNPPQAQLQLQGQGVQRAEGAAPGILQVPAAMNNLHLGGNANPLLANGGVGLGGQRLGANPWQPLAHNGNHHALPNW